MSDTATPEQRDPTRSALPFIMAGVITVLVIVAILLVGLLKPTGKVSDTDLVATAIRNFATAETQNSEAEAANTCTGFDPRKSPVGPNAVGKQVDIVTIADTKINGGNATATVTSRVAGKEATSTWNINKNNGGFWRVCNN